MIKQGGLESDTPLLLVANNNEHEKVHYFTFGSVLNTTLTLKSDRSFRLCFSRNRLLASHIPYSHV